MFLFFIVLLFMFMFFLFIFLLLFLFFLIFLISWFITFCLLIFQFYLCDLLLSLKRWLSHTFILVFRTILILGMFAHNWRNLTEIGIRGDLAKVLWYGYGLISFIVSFYWWFVYLWIMTTLLFLTLERFFILLWLI